MTTLITCAHCTIKAHQTPSDAQIHAITICLYNSYHSITGQQTAECIISEHTQ